VTAATVHGYAVAYAVGASFLAAALVLTLVLVNARKEDVNQGEEPAMAMG
jgi:hypothetical protein